MTFQQLEYIVAVDKYRHFVNAATACGVTQATLSSLIQKLEEEIDVIIFDRSKRPIEPTTLGKKIIAQANLILHNSKELRELVASERSEESGTLRLGIVPSVACYLYPTLVKLLRAEHPNIAIECYEEPADPLISKMQHSELDMAVLPSHTIEKSNLMGIELYTERFMAYVSASHRLSQQQWVRPEDLQDGEIWTLTEFHDRYPALINLTRQSPFHPSQIAAGSFATLLQMVDVGGGHTIIPQLMEKILSADQKQRLKLILSDKTFRTVSLVIREDYMRERMLNIIVAAIKQIIPDDMLVERLKKFSKITI